MKHIYRLLFIHSLLIGCYPAVHAVKAIINTRAIQPATQAITDGVCNHLPTPSTKTILTIGALGCAALIGYFGLKRLILGKPQINVTVQIPLRTPTLEASTQTDESLITALNDTELSELKTLAAQLKEDIKNNAKN